MGASGPEYHASRRGQLMGGFADLHRRISVSRAATVPQYQLICRSGSSLGLSRRSHCVAF